MKRGLLFVLLSLFLLVLSSCGKSYTVVFDLNGGQLVSGETIQTVKSGEPAFAPVVENDGAELS